MERSIETLKPNTYSAGLRDGVPIGLGYLSVSFSFGIMAVSSGIPLLWTLLISMTNLTSAGQLAGIGIIAAGGSLTELALSQLIINSRYFLMSLSLSQRVDSRFHLLHRLVTSFGVTDEVFAVAASRPHEISPRYMYGLITMPYIGWSLGTLLGAAAGAVLPEFVCNALGIAIYGMFLAIILPPARKEKPVRIVVLIAIAVSLMFNYLPVLNRVSGGFVVIICAVVAAALGAVLFPIKDEGRDAA